MIFNNDESKLACFLSDNTVRVVELHNDKNTILLKSVINPHGVKTQRNIQSNSKKFPWGIKYNESTKIICTNGVSGKLQFIDLTGR